MPSNDPAQDDSCAPSTPLPRFPCQVPPWLCTTLIVPQIICTYLYYLVPLSQFCSESCLGIRGFYEHLSNSQYTFRSLLQDSSRLFPWSILHTYLSHRGPICNRSQETSLPFRNLRCWTSPLYFISCLLVFLDYQPWISCPRGLTSWVPTSLFHISKIKCISLPCYFLGFSR